MAENTRTTTQNVQDKHTAPQQNKPAAGRPWPVSVLIVGVGLITLLRGLRAVLALTRWDFLTTIPITVSPLYFFLEGVLWSGVGGILVVGLWRGLPWGRWATQTAALLYSAWTWIVLLGLKAPEIRRTRWPFTLAITLLGLGLVALSLNTKASRTYFSSQNSDD
mgnify:CR=1 FL=1